MGGACNNPDFCQLADRLRIISLTRSLLLFIMTFTTFWEKLHNQIILASRCDNIASLLSDSTKYAFAATQNDQTELETEFDLDTVLNLPVSAFDEGIDLEATTYVAGYITHKVRAWYWYLSSFLFHIFDNRNQIFWLCSLKITLNFNLTLMQQYIGRDKCFVTFCACKRLFHATVNQWSL